MKKNTTKRSLALSVLSLVLCVAMLLGTTFAWFTDSVTSGRNKIIAGNLDVELYHSGSGLPDTTKDADKIGSNTEIFKVNYWEPGMIVYENFAVANVGTLALKYQFKLNTFKYNSYNGHDLTEVLKVAVVENGFSGDRAAAQALTNYVPLSNFALAGNGWLEAKKSSDPFGVVIYWEPGDNDNLYNVNNYTGTRPTSDGEPLFVEFGVDLIATQKDFEADSFDNTYDITAADFAETSVKPIVKPLIVPVDPKNERIVREPEEGESLTLEVENQDMTVTYTVGTKLTSETAIASDKKTADAKLGFEFKSETSNIGVTAGVGQKLANYELTLNIDQANTFLNKVTKKIPQNLVNVVAFHNSKKMAPLANENAVPSVESYFYNRSTGILTIWVFHASEIDVIYDLPVSTDWYNETDDTFIIKNAGELIGFAQLVNEGKTFKNKTVKLADNINISNTAWEPIGHSSYDKALTDPDCRYFAGTFDGNNKTIDGLTNAGYIVPTEQKNGSEATFGLFGRISGATIKNVKLTNVDMSDIGWYAKDGEELGFTGAGALIGCACDEADVLVENCNVSGSIIADNNVSGLFGWIQFSLLEDGIKGQCNFTIKDCTSSVNIVTGKDAGGIVILRCDPQDIPVINRNVNVINCINNGNITCNDGNSQCFIAGIVCEQICGNCYYPENLLLTISGCTNSGNLSGTGSSGDRIVGGILCSKDTFDFTNVVENCTNSGTLTYNGSGFYVGAIASSAGFLTMRNCTDTSNADALVGRVYNRVIVDTADLIAKCGNNGVVEGQIIVLNTDQAADVVVSGGAASDPLTLTSSNKTFDGWFTEQTGGSKLNDLRWNGNYTHRTYGDSDGIIYARWK